MRKLGWLVVIACAVSVVACTQQTTPSKKTPVTSKQVMKTTQNALDTMQTYMEQQKEDYQEKVAAQLERFGHRVDKLQAIADKAEKAQKSKLEDQIGILKKKKDAARQLLEKLNETAEQPWETVKTSLDATITELEKEFDKAFDSLG